MPSVLGQRNAEGPDNEAKRIDRFVARCPHKSA